MFVGDSYHPNAALFNHPHPKKPSLGGVAERSEFKNNIIAGGDVTFSKGDRREAVVDEGLDFACEIQKAKLSMLPGFTGFAG